MKQATRDAASQRSLKPALKGKSVNTFRRSVTVEILSLIFTGAFTACGALILSPVLPFYVMQHNATAFEWSLISSAYSLCQMFSAPLLGSLSDRIGRRPVLLGGIFFSAVFYLLLSETHTVYGLVAVRAALGLACGTEPVEIAYISDLTRKEDRPAWISLQMTIEAAGAVAGPAIGAVVAPFGFNWICRAMGAICAVNFLLGLVFFTEPEHLRFIRIAEEPEVIEEDGEDLGNAVCAQTSEAREMLRYFGQRTTGPLLVGAFLDSFSLAVSDGPEAYYLHYAFAFTEPDLGAFLMVCSAVVLVVSWVAPKVVGALPAKSVCVVGSALCALMMPVMPVCRYLTPGEFHGLKALWSPYVYAVSISCFSSVVEIVSKTTLLSKMVPGRQRGAIYGISSALLKAGFTLGAPLGGFIYDQTNIGFPYFLSSAAFLCSALAYSLLPSSPPPLMGEALLQRQCTQNVARTCEHWANDVPLPNKRFATRLQANQARRVFFVDDDLYEAFHEKEGFQEKEDASRKVKKSHSIGVASMHAAVKSARQMRPSVEELSRGCTMDF